MNYQIYCDGSYKGNIGMCIGVYIIKKEGNETIKEEYITKSYENPESAQIAELLAIKAALERLDSLTEKNSIIRIFTDNLLVVNTINYKIIKGKDNFISILEEILEKIKKYDNIQIKWIPRKENKKAHRLCRSLYKQMMLRYKAKSFNVKKIKDGKYLVQHRKKRKLRYKVNLNKRTCNCEWFFKRRNVENIKCEHIIAVEMQEK